MERQNSCSRIERHTWAADRVWLAKQKKLNWHELELSSLKFGERIEGTGKSNIGLRYQYTIPVFKSIFDGALKPFVGAGIEGLGWVIRFTPGTSNLIPSRVAG